ncbi:MAG: hypothetical protein J6U53_05370 [Tidjanibacter sp.]|nr:hypothetical protein [Tidjanibacter sp.]
MKRLLSILVSLSCVLSLFGQNNAESADDMARIILTPYVAGTSTIPSHAAMVVENKLNQVVTKYGVGSKSMESQFIITANLIEMSKDFTATAPVMVSMILAPTIYIGNGYTGELYSSCQLPEVRGVGENETKAYMAAIKQININSKELGECIEIGKTRIIEYYNSQIDFIISEAEALSKRQEWNEAILHLAAVPKVCKEAYEKAMLKIADVYQEKIDIEGGAKYNEAYAQWKADKSKESATRVVELLAGINPSSAYVERGRKLSAQVESHYAELVARRRAIEDRNWQFKVRQYQDAQDLKKMQQESSVENKRMLIEFAAGAVSEVTSVFKGSPAPSSVNSSASQPASSSKSAVGSGRKAKKQGIASKIASWFK